MNTTLQERLENAKWSGRNDLTIKVSELDALLQAFAKIRQEKIQLMRDGEELGDGEKLIGFIKLDSMQEMRQSRGHCCRLLRYKRAEFVVPVYVKLSVIGRLSE